MWRWVRRWLGPCLHEDTYLERRDVLGRDGIPELVGVLHEICRRCGRKRPALFQTIGPMRWVR